MKKKNQQDATLVNVRAAKKRVSKVDQRVDAVSERVERLEEQVKYLQEQVAHIGGTVFMTDAMPRKPFSTTSTPIKSSAR